MLGELKGIDGPVPEVLGVCDDEYSLDADFYLTEFAKGRMFYDQPMQTVERSGRRMPFDAKATSIARFHASEPADIGLADSDRGDGSSRDTHAL